MNIYAIISLVSAIISFTLGIIIITKDPKKSLNRKFLLMCISSSILSFSEFGMRTSESFESAYIWFIISSEYPIISFFLFNYCLGFSEKINERKLKKITPLFYLFGFLITSLSFFLVFLGRVPVKKYWGWTYSLSSEPLIFNLLLVIIVTQIILVLLSLILIFEVLFDSKSSILRKKQAKFISIGISFPIFIYIYFDFIIDLIYSAENPEIVSVGFVFLGGIVFYAMWKYELFSLDLTTASERIFSTISDCLILTDNEGNILSINKGLLDLLGFQEKELKNKPFIILLASEQDHKLYQYQSQLLVNKENGEFLTDVEVDFKTKANEKIKISLTASKINDKSGNLRGIIYIGRNITKTRKIEQQLEDTIQKSQFKSKFMASMSHELRTPLNAIMGFVELLLENYCGPLNKCQNDFLSDVKLSSNDLLELINRLLDLSKIESGELKLEVRGINIDTLLNHIQTILKPLCRKKNLEFYIENVTISEFINADFVRLKEILFNLLNNAMKFTQKGSVTLRVKELNDHFEFNVIDTGIGIAENEFGNIFEEFKKINNPEIRDSQGVGLGLAITHHLVTLHGGQISFSSDVGKGSTFTFTIPK